MYIYSIYVDGELAVRGTAQQLADMGLYCGKEKNVRSAYAQYCCSVRDGRKTVRQWKREGTPEKPGPKPKKKPEPEKPRKSVEEKKPEKGSDSINRLNRNETSAKEKQIARMRQETIGREERAQTREKRNALRQKEYRKAHPGQDRKSGSGPMEWPQAGGNILKAEPEAGRNAARCHKPPPPLREGATPLERDLWELDRLNWERRKAGKPPKSYGFWRWDQDRMKLEAAACAEKRRKKARRKQEGQDAAEEVPGQAV